MKMLSLTVFETYRYASGRDGYFQAHATGCNCRNITGRRVFQGRTSSLERIFLRLYRDMLNGDYGYRRYRISDLAPLDCWEDFLLGSCLAHS
jgi:hypothetical protein